MIPSRSKGQGLNSDSRIIEVLFFSFSRCLYCDDYLAMIIILQGLLFYKACSFTRLALLPGQLFSRLTLLPRGHFIFAENKKKRSFRMSKYWVIDKKRSYSWSVIFYFITSRILMKVIWGYLEFTGIFGSFRIQFFSIAQVFCFQGLFLSPLKHRPIQQGSNFQRR